MEHFYSFFYLCNNRSGTSSIDDQQYSPTSKRLNTHQSSREGKIKINEAILAEKRNPSAFWDKPQIEIVDSFSRTKHINIFVIEEAKQSRYCKSREHSTPNTPVTISKSIRRYSQEVQKNVFLHNPSPCLQESSDIFSSWRISHNNNDKKRFDT